VLDPERGGERVEAAAQEIAARSASRERIAIGTPAARARGYL
jgi:hypothetical protein